MILQVQYVPLMGLPAKCTEAGAVGQLLAYTEAQTLAQPAQLAVYASLDVAAPAMPLHFSLRTCLAELMREAMLFLAKRLLLIEIGLVASGP